MQLWGDERDLRRGTLAFRHQFWIDRRYTQAAWNDRGVGSEVRFVREQIRHWGRVRVAEVEMLDAQYVFDGSEHIDGVVVGGDCDSAFAVGGDDISEGTVRIDVIRAVLSVVLK